MARRFSTVAVEGLTFFLATFFFTSIGLACLAEYRSPDWLVGHSPFVFIGTVERIDNRPADNAKNGRSAREEPAEGAFRKPTIATVQITKVLKGDYSETHVRVAGGPCRSCGDDWYYSFRQGEQYIFILPQYPTSPSSNRQPQSEQGNKEEMSKSDSPIGDAALEWGGSLLPLSATNQIESEIARLVAYRAEYLAEVQKERPKTFVAGIQLAERMRKEKLPWIEAEKKFDDKYGDQASKVREEFSGALLNTLKDIPLEAIYVAQAQDWFSEKSDPWWAQAIWNKAMTTLVESRRAEVAALYEAWERSVLVRAHVEKKYIDEYFHSLKEIGVLFPRSPLTFPPTVAGVDVYYRKERNESEQALFDSALTTDFILRYHSPYRGMMLPAYAGEFSAEVLTGLNPSRVRLPVVSMYNSDNERLRWLSQQAIGYMPGTNFVDLPLDDLMENGKPRMWRILDHYRRPKETAGRLNAMIDLASERYNTMGKAMFWDTLRTGECFNSVCINRAITALAQAENANTTEKNSKDAEYSDSDRVRLAKALRSYLDAAKAYRSPQKSAENAAADYKQWFNDHPEKVNRPEETEQAK